MQNRIIQLVPWRDDVLALTEQGEIYRLTRDNALEPALGLQATLIFSGLVAR